jgi:ABC-type glycerol-3-phosphate transport system substrate-binding protein
LVKPDTIITEEERKVKRNLTVTRRSFLRSIAGVGGALALAACAPKAQPTAAPAPAEKKEEVAKPATQAPAAKGKITVKIQTPATVNTMDMVNKCIAEYMEKHPDVQVISEETVYGEIATKIETGFIAGTLQDIPYGHSRWYPAGCARGIFKALDDYIASSPPDDFEDFFPLVMEVNKFEGKQYSLPQFVHAGGNIVFIWNKNILADAGVDEPKAGWTWQDLAEMAKKVANKEKGIFGADWVVNAIHYYENYSRCWGEPNLDDKSGWLMSEDGRKFQFTSPACEEASKLYVDLRKAGAIPMAGDQIEGGLFIAGKQAFTSAGTSGQRTFETQMINSKSQNPDAAWDVMKALTDKDISTWGILHGALQPGRRSCWYDEEVNKVIPAFKPCAEIIDKGLERFPMPWNLRFVEANDVYQNEGDAIWTLEKTWDEHAQVVQDNVQKVLDMGRPT